MEYRKLEDPEKDFVHKIVERCGNMISTESLRISVISQQPFTMVALKNGSDDFYVGFSKQCQYEPSKDKWHPVTGKKIALSRAVRMMEARTR